jgi:hypothetical protein
MVKFMCHNCEDQLFKSITSILNHVWDKHGVEVVKNWVPLCERPFQPRKSDEES